MALKVLPVRAVRLARLGRRVRWDRKGHRAKRVARVLQDRPASEAIQVPKGHLAPLDPPALQARLVNQVLLGPTGS